MARESRALSVASGTSEAALFAGQVVPEEAEASSHEREVRTFLRLLAERPDNWQLAAGEPAAVVPGGADSGRMPALTVKPAPPPAPAAPDVIRGDVDGLSLHCLPLAIAEAAVRENSDVVYGEALTDWAVEIRPVRGSGGGSGSGARSASWHHAEAFKARSQGDMMGALASYTRALRLSPRDFKSLFNRGFIYERIGKYNEAVKDFTAASALQPANSFVHFNSGVTLIHLERFAEAEAALSRAIELSKTKNFMFYVARGWARRKLSKFFDATADYVLARQVAPPGAIPEMDRGDLRILKVAKSIFQGISAARTDGGGFEPDRAETAADIARRTSVAGGAVPVGDDAAAAAVAGVAAGAAADAAADAAAARREAARTCVYSGGPLFAPRHFRRNAAGSSLSNVEHIKQILSTPLRERSEADYEVLIDLTRGSRLFASVSDATHRALCDRLVFVQFRARQRIFRQGRRGDNFFVIVSGTVSVWHNSLPPGVTDVLTAPNRHKRLPPELDPRPPNMRSPRHSPARTNAISSAIVAQSSTKRSAATGGAAATGGGGGGSSALPGLGASAKSGGGGGGGESSDDDDFSDDDGGDSPRIASRTGGAWRAPTPGAGGGIAELGEHIGTLYAGESFGETALTQPGSRRPVSVSTVLETCMVALSVRDYLDVVAEARERERAEVVLFLRKVPLFSGVPEAELAALADEAKHSKYLSGRVVVVEGSPLNHLYLLKRGMCSVVLGAFTAPAAATAFRAAEAARRLTASDRSSRRGVPSRVLSQTAAAAAAAAAGAAADAAAATIPTPRPSPGGAGAMMSPRRPPPRGRGRPVGSPRALPPRREATMTTNMTGIATELATRRVAAMRRKSIQAESEFRRASVAGGISVSAMATEGLEGGELVKRPITAAWTRMTKVPLCERTPSRVTNVTGDMVRPVSHYDPVTNAALPAAAAMAYDVEKSGPLSLGKLMPLDYFGEAETVGVRALPAGEGDRQLPLRDHEKAPASVVCETFTEFIIFETAHLHKALSFRSRQRMRDNALRSSVGRSVYTTAQQMQWEAAKASALRRCLSPRAFSHE